MILNRLLSEFSKTCQKISTEKQMTDLESVWSRYIHRDCLICFVVYSCICKFLPPFYFKQLSSITESLPYTHHFCKNIIVQAEKLRKYIDHLSWIFGPSFAIFGWTESQFPVSWIVSRINVYSLDTCIYPFVFDLYDGPEARNTQ